MAVTLPRRPAIANDQHQRRSKSPTPCPSVCGKVLELRRSHSHCTNDDNRTFLAADFLVGEILGQGFFGQAIKVTHVRTGEHLVLKELLSHDDQADNGFRREIIILRSLSHPCLLKYLGVVYREKTLSLITEYMEGGSLSNMLLDLTVPLSWTRRLSFARDIAAGMSYLHSLGIIHRDLTSHNCLVRQDHTVVVADLGLAEVISLHKVPGCHCQLAKPNEEEATGGDAPKARGSKRKRVSHQQRGAVVGHPYWMAPEKMLTGIYDGKADVFSYGIILCETIARVTADPDYLPRSKDFSLNVEVFHKRYCEQAPEPYVMLAVLCSQLDPEHRPSFEMVQVMCESLILHTEHGAAVPRDLQGSTIDFYHSLKEKLYGKDYKDIDSCLQVHTGETHEHRHDVFTRQGHIKQSANQKGSIHSRDVDQLLSDISSFSQTEFEHSCSATDITSSADKNTRIKPTTKHCTRQPECDNEIIFETNERSQLFRCSDTEIVKKIILNGNVSISSSLPTNSSHFTSQNGINFYGSVILHNENINLITQSGKKDNFLGSITISQKDDDAYFSSSSRSSSCLSLSLSSEDSSTCESSPHRSHFVHKIPCSSTG